MADIAASNWAGVPFWVWILGAAGMFALLFGLLFFGGRQSGEPRTATAAPPAPDEATAARSDPAPAPADGSPDRDVAVAVFPHVNGAERAFAAVQEHERDAPWLRDTTFVESHQHGRLVVRGTFAGHYLNVDGIAQDSPSATIARALVDTAFDDLDAQVPAGSSALLVFGAPADLDAMVADLGARVTRRHLTRDETTSLEAAASAAPPAAPPA